jgi:hypothetical protein
MTATTETLTVAEAFAWLVMHDGRRGTLAASYSSHQEEQVSMLSVTGRLDVRQSGLPEFLAVHVREGAHRRRLSMPAALASLVPADIGHAVVVSDGLTSALHLTMGDMRFRIEIEPATAKET